MTGILCAAFLVGLKKDYSDFLIRNIEALSKSESDNPIYTIVDIVCVIELSDEEIAYWEEMGFGGLYNGAIETPATECHVGGNDYCNSYNCDDVHGSLFGR